MFLSFLLCYIRVFVGALQVQRAYGMLDVKASLRVACCLAVFVGSVHSYSMENPCKNHNDAKCTAACREIKNLPHGYCKGDHCECTTQARAVVETEPDPCEQSDTGTCVMTCADLSFEMGQCVEKICHCLNANDVQPGTRLSDAKASASKKKQATSNAAPQPHYRTAPEIQEPRQPQESKRMISSSQQTYVPLLELLEVPKDRHYLDPCRNGLPEQCASECGRLHFDQSTCFSNVCRCGSSTRSRTLLETFWRR